MDNDNQTFVYNTTTNRWDNGYPSGGNHWSDYTGADINGDGIGDTPYIVDANNTDHYPLMTPYPWEPHGVGVTYIGRVYEIGVGVEVAFPPRTVVGLGLLLHLDVFVRNYDDYPEALNLTVYVNSTVAGQVSNVTLAARNSTILDIQWPTSGFAMGNYTISAHLEPVPGESDIEDNNYTVGYTMITILGDVNGDGKVDMRDIGYVARKYGRSPASPLWDSNADINDDAKIDMRDIGIIARHYGQHYP